MDDGFDALRKRNQQRQEQERRNEAPKENEIDSLPFWKIILRLIVSLARDFWNTQFPKADLTKHSPAFLHYMSRSYDKRNAVGFDEENIVDVPPPPSAWKFSERRAWNQKYGQYVLSPSEAMLRKPPKAYTHSREVPVIIKGRRVSKLGAALFFLLAGLTVSLGAALLRGMLL